MIEAIVQRAFIISLLCFLLLRLAHLNFLPIWDGRKYFDCLRHASAQPFNHQNFNCFLHPTALTGILMAIPLFIDSDNILIFNIFTTLLGIIAIFAFYQICKLLFPKKELAIERSLLVLTFSLYPIFLANSINFTFDYVMIIFFLLAIYSLLYKKFLLAFVSLLFLSFSKEIGALLGFFMVLIYIVSFIIATKKTFKKKLAKLYLAMPLFIPTTIYAIYYYFNDFSLIYYHFNDFPLEVHNTKTAFIKELVNLNVFNPLFRSSLAAIFVLNFNWLMTVFIVFYFLKSILTLSVPKNSSFKFIIILFFASLYVSTSYLIFTNPRYFLSVYPLLILVFYIALRDFEKSKKIRIATLFILLILTTISLFRTIDPVSKHLFGTFNFGKHPILNMTSISGECCGYGRDQLVYNLEFTNFHFIENKIRDYLNQNPEIPVTHNPYGNHLIACPLIFYADISQRNDDHICTPRYISIPELLDLAAKPKKLYYIAYPFVKNQESLSVLLDYYQIINRKVFNNNGYSYPVYTLSLATLSN